MRRRSRAGCAATTGSPTTAWPSSRPRSTGCGRPRRWRPPGCAGSPDKLGVRGLAVTENAGLYRSYQRLLAAYPRSYRRVREIEMLTTLMDAAPPVAARPTVREGARPGRWRRALPAAGAARSGVPGRRRRDRPARRAVVAGGAALAAWNLADTRPSTSEAPRPRRDAVAGDPPLARRCTRPTSCTSTRSARAPHRATRATPARPPAPVSRHLYLPPGGIRPVAARPGRRAELVADRLTACRLAVDDPVVNEASAVFWAHRDDLAVQVTALVGDQAPNQGGSYARATRSRSGSTCTGSRRRWSTSPRPRAGSSVGCSVGCTPPGCCAPSSGTPRAAGA